MYVIINKETNEAIVTNQKTSAAKIIGVHRNTIINNLKKENPSEIKGFTIYEAKYIKGNQSKGNTFNWGERQKRALEKDGY